MKVTEMISITELSRLIGKSRPTIYKYIYDYEHNDLDMVPNALVSLFNRIKNENISKREIYEYCDKYFANLNDTSSTYDEVIYIIKNNKEKLDLGKLKRDLLKEIDEYGK